MNALCTGMTDVINLGIGEPDFATPAEVTARALADARQGHIHYTASQGDPELILAIVTQLSEELARKRPLIHTDHPSRDGRINRRPAYPAGTGR